MKIRSTITKLIVITMALTAMAVIGSSWMAGRAGAAGRSDINDIYVFRSIIGITSEQALRVSVGNPTPRPGKAWYRVSDTAPGGVPLYESEWIQVPQGEFRFSDVSREDLDTEGELGTGRAQGMVTVTLQVPAGSNPEDLIGSLEVVDDRTGATTGGPYSSGYVKVSGDG